MSAKNINFDDKKIKKSTFYKNKRIYVVLTTLMLIIY